MRIFFGDWKGAGPEYIQFAETLNLPRGHFEIIRELQNEREKV